MRHHLLASSSSGYFLNLHGNGNLKERALDGTPDENVFDIRQGVGITVFSRRKAGGASPNVFAADLYGTRESKYQSLRTCAISNIGFVTVTPKAPNYFVVHRNEEGIADYSRFTPIPELFEVGGLGFQSHRDAFVVAFSKNELAERMKIFLT